MTNPLFQRTITITSLYTALAGLPEQELLSFYGLTWMPETCCDIPSDIPAQDCNVTWYEVQTLSGGIASNPTRVMWSNFLAKNERKIAEFLGYWPGPHWEQNEVHRVQNWTRFIKTRYCNVVRAGQRKLTKISEGLPQTVTRQTSPFSPFNDLLIITIGDMANPLVIDPVCNFFIYPDGYELQDQWSIRPWEVLSYENGQLTLCAPLWVAVDPINYYKFGGNLKKLCLCDDIYFDSFHVYQESWELPHGKVRLAKEYCPYCGGSGDPDCEVCNLPEIDICLRPRDWRAGVFEIIPIVNTGTEEEPCWEQFSELEDCCKQLLGDNLKPISAKYMFQCYCTMPLDVEIDYVSSCDGSWFDNCLLYETCPELLRPLVEMTLADMPKICNCGCLDEKKEALQQDLLVLSSGTRTQQITEGMLSFGTRRGDIEAYLYLKNFMPRKKKAISYI